jgi:hypothetical protein
MSGFKKAERKNVRFKMAMTGPSGGGKTFSALLIAKGLATKPDGTVGKIAVIDTENDSASLYAGKEGMPEFDAQGIEAPFHTDKYLKAIREAVAAGYEVLVIDSVSHQWSGKGGILDRKDTEEANKPTLNRFTNWAKYTPEHEAFKDAINQSDIHIISTMRSKQEYVLVDGNGGKTKPEKMGAAPIQREGAEYEYSLVLDMNMQNVASVSKDRTGLFFGTYFKPSIETGLTIRDWLMTGKEVARPVAALPPVTSSAAGPKPKPTVAAKPSPRVMALNSVMENGRTAHWPAGSVAAYSKAKYGTDKLSELSSDHFLALLETIKLQTSESAQLALVAPGTVAMAPEPQPEWAEGQPTHIQEAIEPAAAESVG